MDVHENQYWTNILSLMANILAQLNVQNDRFSRAPTQFYYSLIFVEIFLSSSRISVIFLKPQISALPQWKHRVSTILWLFYLTHWTSMQKKIMVMRVNKKKEAPIININQYVRSFKYVWLFKRWKLRMLTLNHPQPCDGWYYLPPWCCHLLHLHQLF